MHECAGGIIYIMKIIKPPKISIGDSIGIVTVSFPFPERAILNQDLTAIRQLGFKTVLARNVYGYSKPFTESISERVLDFEEMVKNPEIKAIVFSSGGAHTINLVDQIDYSLIRSNPKPIIGFSDNTFLLCAIHAMTDLVTFYGPTATYCFSRMSNYSKNNFLNAIMQSEKPIGKIKSKKKWHIIRKGKAEGRLIGGNLSALQALVGTPYEPDWENRILFIEQFNTPTILLSESLNHLRIAGVFEKISGLLIGHLPGCIDADRREHRSLRSRVSINNIIKFQTRGYDFPIISNVNFGHDLRDYLTMPNGIELAIDTHADLLAITETSVK